MIAVIDIGSNTVRLNAYKTHGNSFHVMFSEKEMAGLASHIEDNQLTEAGLLNLLRILDRFKTVLTNLHITRVFPFATASLRNIENSSEVLSKIEAEIGYNVHLISGEEEGFLGFLGSKSVASLDKGLVVDIGGGSTELVLFEHDKVLSSRSLAMGSLNMYKNFVKKILPKDKEQKNIQTEILNYLSVFNHKKAPKVHTIIGVGGTIRAALKLENYLYHNYGNRVISHKKLLDIIDRISDGSREAQVTILKVIPDRIHTIIPGLLILKEVMAFFECEEVIVSENGAREGYLIKYVLKEVT